MVACGDGREAQGSMGVWEMGCRQGQPVSVARFLLPKGGLGCIFKVGRRGKRLIWA